MTVWTYAFMYPVAAYLADVLQELGFRSRVQTSGSERAAQMGVAG